MCFKGLFTPLWLQFKIHSTDVSFLFNHLNWSQFLQGFPLQLILQAQCITSTHAFQLLSALFISTDTSSAFSVCIPTATSAVFQCFSTVLTGSFCFKPSFRLCLPLLQNRWLGFSFLWTPRLISPNWGFPTHKQAPGTSACAPCVPLSMGKPGMTASVFPQTFVYPICLLTLCFTGELHSTAFIIHEKKLLARKISFHVFKGKVLRFGKYPHSFSWPDLEN